MKPQKRVFTLIVPDSKGQNARFEFEADYHAESVLRGLVHSGYTVTINEAKVDYTEEELEEMQRDVLDPCECPPPTPRYALRA